MEDVNCQQTLANIQKIHTWKNIEIQDQVKVINTVEKNYAVTTHDILLASGVVSYVKGDVSSDISVLLCFLPLSLVVGG